MGWLSGWQYRKSHEIVGSTAGAVSNYPIKIVVHYGSGTDSGEDVYLNGKCRTDFGDIRFTDSDGTTELYYWMEEYVDSDYAIFWVKIPSIPTSPDTTQIYIYYGNPDQTTTSNGENTFEFFDDFLGTSLDTNKWVNESQARGKVIVTDGYLELDSPAGTNTKAIVRSVPYFNGSKALEYKYMYVNFGVECNHHVRYEDSAGENGVRKVESEYYTDDYRATELIAGTQYVRDGKNKVWNLNLWYRETLKMSPDTIRIILDGVEELTGTLSADHTAQDLYVRLLANGWGGGDAITVRFDFIAVRNYIDPEPSHGAWGSEETSGIPYTVEVSDVVKAVELFSKLKLHVITDTIKVQDVIEKYTQRIITVEDLIKSQDILKKSLHKTISLEDLIKSQDILEKSLHKTISLEDLLIVSDSVKVYKVKTISLEDLLTVLDSVEVYKVKTIQVADILKPQEFLDIIYVSGVKPPITEWHRRRNDRIYEFLLKHDEFTIREFHLYVWRERLLFDERYHSHKPLSTFMDSPLSTFIRNFTRYLLWELEHAGIIQEDTYNGLKIYKVLKKPSKEFIYEICSYRDP